MKKLSALLLTLVCVSSAFAGNDGPQADSRPIVRVFAQSRFSGGLFVPPNAAVSRTLNISTDGSVSLTFGYRQAPEQTVKVATLSPELTAKLVKDVEASVAGDVVDTDPSNGCEDAPSGHYSAIKSNGTEIVLAKNQRCKDLQKENLNSQESEVLRTLKSLTEIGYLLSR